jgi:Holliday junction resolvase RusA-like endonuclease
MNEPEHLVLWGVPPTSNHGYSLTVRGGHACMYKAAAAVAWQDASLILIATQRKGQIWADVDIGMEIAYFCKNKNRDIDGGVKLTLDTVAQALGFNDRRVVWLDVRKWTHKGQVEETRVRVTQRGGQDGNNT